jgi:vesicle coat complex subunit
MQKKLLEKLVEDTDPEVKEAATDAFAWIKSYITNGV